MRCCHPKIVAAWWLSGGVDKLAVASMILVESAKKPNIVTTSDVHQARQPGRRKILILMIGLAVVTLPLNSPVVLGVGRSNLLRNMLDIHTRL